MGPPSLVAGFGKVPRAPGAARTLDLQDFREDPIFYRGRGRYQMVNERCRVELAYHPSTNRTQLAREFGVDPKSVNRNSFLVASTWVPHAAESEN